MTHLFSHHALDICILGCGSSAGVPLVGHEWGVCDGKNSKNHRTRCGVMLCKHEHTWLIDVTPDFRQQALRENITRIDGVLLTHAHFDHIGGLDDLKPFAIRQGQPIPLWMDTETYQTIAMRYPYALFGNDHAYSPFLKPEIIDGPFSIDGMSVHPFEQDHGFSKSLGFRFSTWAYSTDVVALNPEAMNILQGLDVWFVDCMGMTPKKTHAHWDITLDWIDILQPKQSILIHMGIEMDYQTLCHELPQHIRPAYDGLRMAMTG